MRWPRASTAAPRTPTRAPGWGGAGGPGGGWRGGARSGGGGRAPDGDYDGLEFREVDLAGQDGAGARFM
ncbi:hypothetical protein ACFU5P_22000, partial [Streptomyces sp. NPDC057433]